MNSVPSHEISRKFLHLFASIIPLGYLWLIPDREMMTIILGGLSLFAVLLEMSRKKWEPIEEIFESYFNFMLRPSEFEGSMTGATWLLFGSTLTVFLFPIQVAVPALLFLTVGDTFAAIVGKSFPIGRIKEKTLSGTFAGIVTSICAGLWINLSLPTDIIILGAVSVMAVEVAPIPMNDNLTIPLTGGFVMTYGMMIL